MAEQGKLEAIWKWLLLLMASSVLGALLANFSNFFGSEIVRKLAQSIEIPRHAELYARVLLALLSWLTVSFIIILSLLFRVYKLGFKVKIVGSDNKPIKM